MSRCAPCKRRMHVDCERHGCTCGCHYTPPKPKKVAPPPPPTSNRSRRGVPQGREENVAVTRTPPPGPAMKKPHHDLGRHYDEPRVAPNSSGALPLPGHCKACGRRVYLFTDRGWSDSPDLWVEHRCTR